MFQEEVTFHPANEEKIKKIFKMKLNKRLQDMLTKARKSGNRPDWIGQQVWNDLLSYWASPEFTQISQRNRVNRASARGGAVHTSGRKSHVDVALELVRMLLYISLNIYKNC